MIKAVFLDLDGTLLDCTGGKDRISDYSLKVFGKLKEAGILLFIATGRSLSFLPEFIGGAGFDGWVLANGGGVWAGGREIGRHVLDGDFVRTAAGRLEEEGIEYALQIPEGTWMSRERRNLLGHFRKYLFDERRLVGGPVSDCAEKTMKLELYVCPGKVKACREILSPLTCDWDGKTHVMEAYAKDVSKGTGAREILGYFGIAPSECMCFGDDSNDMELFETAGWSVAMSNGKNELKNISNDICESVREDGAARYLERALNSNFFEKGQMNGRD